MSEEAFRVNFRNVSISDLDEKKSGFCSITSFNRGRTPCVRTVGDLEGDEATDAGDTGDTSGIEPGSDETCATAVLISGEEMAVLRSSSFLRNFRA
jgi:hypothetical protein